MPQPTIFDLEGQTQVGDFNVIQGQMAPGTLTLLGPETTVFIWSQNEEIEQLANSVAVTGNLSNSQKISLIGFRKNTIVSHRFGPAGQFNSLTLHPRHVTVGDFFIEPDKHINGVNSF